ncbi:FecR family protein [Pedobacter hiemivivus]|uniref:FecR family protein n=1 Tax=Pedobacter hiemivivus TaxID=2530454 RepID=A0A4R0N8Q9_9SPHI|nr:FecR family protein [Pedobacter hiemivivus]TCC96548.1 FecR family protein [Pedobacter hiemivivus]
MKNSKAEELYQKYRRDEATDEEAAWIESWYLAEVSKTKLLDEDLDYNNIEDRIWSKLEEQRTVKSIRLWPRMIGITATVAIIGFGIWFYTTQLEVHPKAEILAHNDIGPGKTGATLTLANGRKIILSNAPTGAIAEEDGVVVTKSADGQLVYEIKNSATRTSKINTLSTANGETYKVILPDGSSVWLNATSSINYPANFALAKKRIVQLKGEAYFEITQDKKHPFVVLSTGQEIEVLGTHFNINAYPNEANIKTTLLEGSVRISRKDKQQMLEPGQQAIASENGIAIRAVDTDEVIAWKDGYFEFVKSDIQTVMRQISRWYSVDVQYEGPISKETFTGRISRTKNISQILKMVESSNAVQVSIKGRRIMVKN